MDVMLAFQRRLIKRFIRRGYLRPTEDGGLQLYWGEEELTEEEAHLLRCYAASTQMKHAFGEKAGISLELKGISVDELKSRFISPLCVNFDGFGLHAATVIAENELAHLESLCRYIARGPISQDRLVQHEERILYLFKRAWSNGATGVFFDGTDLLERIAALIPVPYKNITRYHGIFAPRSKLRSRAVPGWPESDVQAQGSCEESCEEAHGDIIEEKWIDKLLERMEGDVSVEAGDKVEDKEKSIIISSTYPQEVSASSSLSEKNLPEKPFTTDNPLPPAITDNFQPKTPTKGCENPKNPKKKRRWVFWSELMKRIFLEDVLQCKCGGRRRVIALIEDPSIVFPILKSMDLLPGKRGPPARP